MHKPAGPSPIAELLTELFDRHAAALELYASQWTTTPADSVQVAYIALARLLQQSGTPPKKTTAWLYQVVRNQARNAARAERRRQRHERIAARLTARRRGGGLLLADQRPLLAALEALPMTEREIVVLRIWSELTWREIADLTNI